MSDFDEFAKGALEQASEILGTQGLSIAGGTAVAVNRGERRESREFETGGWDAETVLEVVADLDAFEAVYTAATSSYLGEAATLAGRSYRVASIATRDPAVVIGLVDEEGAP